MVEEAELMERALARRASRRMIDAMVDTESHSEAMRIWRLGAEVVGERVYESITFARALAEQLRNGRFRAGDCAICMSIARRRSTGDASIERFLHGVFARDRIRGEWFTRSRVIVDFIERIDVGVRQEMLRRKGKRPLPGQRQRAQRATEDGRPTATMPRRTGAVEGGARDGMDEATGAGGPPLR